MSNDDDAARDLRLIGIACASAATMLGLAYLAFAGAPVLYLAVNGAALLIGAGLLALIMRLNGRLGLSPGAATLIFAAGLLTATLTGDSVEGAVRWLKLGPLFVQPSLVLLPAMIVSFARLPNLLSTAAMLVAAAALALQPDRAMAFMLAAGMAVLTVTRPDRWVMSAFLAAMAGFAVTMARGDALPAVPYVDRILYSSFDIHLAAGLAVLGGSALLLVPAVVGWLHGGPARNSQLVFGMVWFAAILAAALGNYPTPLVGYGGSAVLGYLLSLAVLPQYSRATAKHAGAEADASAELPRQRLLRAAG